MQYHSCVSILGHAEPQNWFNSGVAEGVVFHYIWLKCLFWMVTIYSDILLFQLFCLKCKIENEKKKKKRKRSLFSDNLGQSEKGKQTFFLKALL